MLGPMTGGSLGASLQSGAKLWDKTKFLAQYALKPGTVGAVVPSSQALAKEMVADLGLERARAVIEFGAGTGSFTRAILPRLAPDCRFVMIELNREFAALLRERFPGQRLHFDDVRNVRAICDREGIDQVDCVISGLPWASFPIKLQNECLDAMMTVLRPGGRFTTFAYEGLALLPRARNFRKKLTRYFSEVKESRTVLANLPPAFVYRCRR